MRKTSDEALFTSLRAMGRAYASNGYAFPTSILPEAAGLVKDVRSRGWTWKAVGEAAGLDPRTVKRIGGLR